MILHAEVSQQGRYDVFLTGEHLNHDRCCTACFSPLRLAAADHVPPRDRKADYVVLEMGIGTNLSEEL
jgi:hypothetical protein